MQTEICIPVFCLNGFPLGGSCQRPRPLTDEGNRAIMARQRVAAGSLPLSGGRRPLLTHHSVLILTFSHQRSQHAKNQAGRYAAGRRRQAAGKRTGQAARVHGILHALCQ